MINQSLNPKRLRRQYAQDQRVRIPDFLESSVALELREKCLHAPYELVYVIDGKTRTTSREKMATLSADERNAINRAIAEQASQGQGYLYGSCHLGAGRPEAIDPLMVALYEQLQGDAVMSLVKDITGDASIQSASGHYTRYVPGHFLTRHRDVHEARKRRFVYVLSLTSGWHPDWGGLLQFYEEDGTPRDAWPPVFNSLTIFDIKHIHAMTYVAPFALEPQLSLTGWFLAG